MEGRKLSIFIKEHATVEHRGVPEKMQRNTMTKMEESNHGHNIRPSAARRVHKDPTEPVARLRITTSIDTYCHTAASHRKSTGEESGMYTYTS